MQISTDLMYLHSPLVQLIVDPYNDEIMLVNQEACRFFFADTLDFHRKRISELFGRSLPLLVVFTQEAMERGHAWSDALVITRTNTRQEMEEKRVEVSARSFYHDEGELLQLCIQDACEIDWRRSQSDANKHYQSGIGHWSRVARVFQEFERENQLILDAVGEGIYGVDKHGMTTFINPTAERILGYRAEELFDRNIHDIIHHSHSDGSDFHAQDCPIYQAFRDGVVRRVEDDVFWSNTGKAIDVEYTSTPIKDNGYVVGAVVVFRDVSQRKSDRKKLLNALSEVKALKHQLELENAYLHEEINSEFNHHHIVGKSIPMQKIMQQINLVAPTDATTIIYGESGTGKELIARAIHDMSQRTRRPLIRVNCAAIPADLFESEFFGHVKGAFTGATADRLGRFELANDGTIFLDEVGEIPLQLQGKLLRVLQEQQFERVGDSKTYKVNVRIIAATNKDLKTLVNKGTFREDLYFRLNVFPIESVPLRDRVDDIPLLAQHFLQRAGKMANKQNLKIPLSEIEKLKRYAWPGNVRELENVIERHVILAQGQIIRFSGLHLEPQDASINTGRPAIHIVTEGESQKQERNRLINALKNSKGKISGAGGAAEMLELKPTTLASRIRKYQIDVKPYK